MFRRRFLGLGASACAIAALGPALRAEAAGPVEVVAHLDSITVETGASTILRVEVTTRDGSSIPEPRIDVPENVVVSNTGQHIVSSGFSFGTGRPTQSVSTQTFVYVVTPVAAGEYDLEISVKGSGGKVVAPKLPALQAVGEGPPPEPELPTEEGAPPRARGKVFLHAAVSPREVYVGQAIVYTLEQWSQAGRGYQISLSERPTFKDFWSTDIERARRRGARLDGLSYSVTPVMSRVLFPQRAGEMTIPGARGIAQSGGLFFGGGGRIPLDAPATPIVVKPLPADGQPANFSAHNVGRFKLSSAIDRKTVIQGDALTLTVTLSGSGNLALAAPAAWPKFEGFRSYDPTANEPQIQADADGVRGKRSWTFLLVAEDAGELKIPAFEMDSFDPELGRYVVTKSKPLVVDVAPNAKSLASKSTDDAEASPDAITPEVDTREDPLAPPVAGDTLPRPPASSVWLDRARWNQLAAALVGTATAVGGGLWLRGRFGPSRDVVAQRERRQWRSEQLQSMRGATDGKLFWAKAAELLQRAALDRLGPDAAGLTRARLRERLLADGASTAEVDTWSALLERADAARFGASDGGASLEAARLEIENLVSAKGWAA